MARPRKKKRTHSSGGSQNATAIGVSKTNPADRTPKSMVIRMGASEVGPSVTQLVHDMRNVMEPHTAGKLKERRSNKLRDYTTMAGPLGVTHFLLFSRSETGNTNLRLAVTPRGPTFHFRVAKYSLCKDVVKSQRRPKSASGGVNHLSPPLLVMNNFNSSAAPDADQKNAQAPPSIPKHLEALTTSMFQSLFPPIAPQKTPLSAIRRVLLLDRVLPAISAANGSLDGSSVEAAGPDSKYILNLRHYAITSKPVISLSRGLKKLRAAEQNTLSRQRKPETRTRATVGQGGTTRHTSTAGLPNMHGLDDVADYLLDPTSAAGYTSASETELDTDAEVEIAEVDARRVLDKKERQRQREQEREAARQAREIQARAPAGGAEGGEDEGEDNDAGGFSQEAEADAGQTKSNTARKGSAAAAAARAVRTQKRVIKLTELGPRLTLRLIKVEEGLCTGKVLWHEHVTKSAKEQRELEVRWEARRAAKEERRRRQKEDVERKKREKAVSAGSNRGHDRGGGDGQEVEEKEEYGQEFSDEDADWLDDDDEVQDEMEVE